MRFSEAKGRKVVSTSTAATVGKVHSYVVDGPANAVIALRLKKTENGDSLVWSKITAFGADAVTVDDAKLITEPDEKVSRLSDRHHRILGKLVLTVDGDSPGKVEDVEFDPSNGQITGLILDDGKSIKVTIVGLGSYAVIVKEPAAEDPSPAATEATTTQPVEASATGGDAQSAESEPVEESEPVKPSDPADPSSPDSFEWADVDAEDSGRGSIG